MSSVSLLSCQTKWLKVQLEAEQNTTNILDSFKSFLGQHGRHAQLSAQRAQGRAEGFESTHATASVPGSTAMFLTLMGMPLSAALETVFGADRMRHVTRLSLVNSCKDSNN